MMGIKRVLLVAAFSVLVGCMDQSTSETKAEFALSATSNPQRAAEILGIIAPTSAGATSGKCARCHGDFKTANGLTKLSDSTWYTYQCFKGDTASDAGKLQALQCLAKLNSNLTASEIALINSGSKVAIQEGIRGLEAANLGVFTAGLSLDSFKAIFSGNDNVFASLLTESWARRAAMPKNGVPLSATDFQVALGWLVNGSPEKEKFLIHNGPQTCSTDTDTFIGENLKSHVTRMSINGEGWMAKNQADGLKMFACDAKGCFQSKTSGRDVFPLVSGILVGEGEVRSLYTLSGEASRFWTRSSADGRYVSYGARPQSIIIDLAPKLTGQSARRMTVEADYDPAFSPDNLSFMYQGEKSGTRFCNQTLLATPSLTRIDFNSDACSTSNLRVGLYQGLGASLDNGEMMTIAGGFRSDEGSILIQDAAPLFTDNATIDISRIRQSDSMVFEKTNVQRVSTPYLGNWMLSPSNKIAIGTLSGSTMSKARHGGFRLVLTDAITGSRLPASLTDSNTATLCVKTGEKPQASFDERFLVYYAYEQHENTVSPSESAANLFAIDLLGTGKPVQLTNLAKGTYAQFPHFRSDGWLYFTLYDSRTRERSVLATDAIIRLAIDGLSRLAD